MADNLQIKKEPADEIPLSDVGLLGALRDSSLLRFVGATLMWGTGHQLITVSQGYLLFELTSSTIWLAALGAAVGIPNVIVAILAGIMLGITRSTARLSRLFTSSRLASMVLSSGSVKFGFVYLFASRGSWLQFGLAIWSIICRAFFWFFGALSFGGQDGL